MTNRLPYETIAGNLSSNETFKQLLENLRLAEEDAHSLYSFNRTRNDPRAAGWKTFAANFHKIQAIVTELAKSKAHSSVGFTPNA